MQAYSPANFHEDYKFLLYREQMNYVQMKELNQYNFEHSFQCVFSVL